MQRTAEARQIPARKDLATAHNAHQAGPKKHGQSIPSAQTQTCPALFKSAGHVKLIGFRKQQARHAVLSKARYLAAQLPADLANDGVDEGRLGHVEFAGRHERDGQGNQPTRHDIR